MLARTIVRIIGLSIRHARIVIGISLLLALACGTYAATHFALNANIGELISSDLPWRQREAAFLAVFPRYDSILAVVEAPTAELVEQATDALTDALQKKSGVFRSVTRPGGGKFFLQHGLLFQDPERLAEITRQFAKAEPLIHDMAADLSLRGLADGLTDGIMGVQSGDVKLDAMSRPLTVAAETIEDVMAGRPASFSWAALVQGRPAEPGELRRFIDVRPVLHYGDLQPGRVGTEAIRQTVADLSLPTKYQARVRLTGPVAMGDEEFATLQDGAVLNGVLTFATVLLILWLALRSRRIILAVLISLFVGLSITAAVGLLAVGALNLISVSFAVLFVGLGVDFGIQFTVRYRAERHEVDDLKAALLAAGNHIGAPLTLAAAAVAAGFLSFLPTAYRGVSELGLIAGLGMVIAFLTSITLLPSLLALMNPDGEPEPLGFSALAPVDRFMERHRLPIIAATALVVLAGLPLLFWMRFDSNPLHLRDPKVESVATLRDLNRDPNTNTNTIEMLAPSLEAAAATAEKLRALPQVSRVLTLASFVPERQPEKLKLIAEAASKLATALEPEPVAGPNDEDVVEALRDEASRLTQIAEGQNGPGAVAARRLAGTLTSLAEADPGVRAKAHAVLVEPLEVSLEQLRALLNPQPVTLDNLPAELRREWMTPDGGARVEVAPKADADDDRALRDFTRAVLAAEPNATGGPVSILETEHTIISAFIQAGCWALASIAVILWIALRRLGDVLLTLIPLLLAGVVTLELCVLIDLPLNFANIIALPLLLGIGVAFKIYYIMAWRAGQTGLLQSSLTRAVMFSALTTATAFGSLWFSRHPGTSSMGKLLALSLLCTLAAAVLFQPVLMGKPRENAKPAGAP
jgi:hopanoid biosynthesis associated RND transporter like protein HpnN